MYKRAEFTNIILQVEFLEREGFICSYHSLLTTSMLNNIGLLENVTYDIKKSILHSNGHVISYEKVVTATFDLKWFIKGITIWIDLNKHFLKPLGYKNPNSLNSSLSSDVERGKEIEIFAPVGPEFLENLEQVGIDIPKISGLVKKAAETAL